MIIEENCPTCGRILPTELKARMNHLIACAESKDVNGGKDD